MASSSESSGYLPGDPRFGLSGEALRHYYREKPAQWMRSPPWSGAAGAMKLIVCAVAVIALTASCGRDEPPPPPPGDVIPSAPGAIGQVHSLQGDVVRVAADAWALLAMVDGATLTLRPATELRLDQYRYDANGEPQQNAAKLSLTRGAVRSITGQIGQSNRAGYEVRTQTAILGVRGTDHEPAYYPPPPPGQKSDRESGTYDKVNEGETFIRRSGGERAKGGQREEEQGSQRQDKQERRDRRQKKGERDKDREP